jgi:hypothetical protein
VTHPSDTPHQLSLEDRAARLDSAIAYEVGNGGRLETHSQTHAVVVFGGGGVLMHLTFVLLTLFTCGLFVFPWIAWANTSREHRVTVTVDPQGRVTRAG